MTIALYALAALGAYRVIRRTVIVVRWLPTAFDNTGPWLGGPRDW